MNEYVEVFNEHEHPHHCQVKKTPNCIFTEIQNDHKTCLSLHILLLRPSFFLLLVMSSHVATEGFPLMLQLIPHTRHLSRRLVMCGVVIFDAPELAELQAVHILYCS